jgi:aspartate racemase
VARIDAQLTTDRVWHKITANTGRAWSCREAANARQRLGKKGIPLCDELQTYLGSYESAEGRRYVAVHYRAHQDCNTDATAEILGAKVTWLAAEELSTEFGMAYGLVNPFLLDGRADVIQLFDQDVLSRRLSPYTMMTNAGDPAWGIEFFPSQLVEHLSNAQVGRVATPSPLTDLRVPVLGILTGNGPESGMELWRRINTVVHEGRPPFQGDADYPNVIVVSRPGMGMSMEIADREDEVRKTVLDGIDSLLDAGATFIGIACNTTQHFSKEIRTRCEQRSAVFMSLVDAVRLELNRLGSENFDLIGIGPVVDVNHWSDFRRLADEFQITVPTERATQAITQLAWDVKAKKGKDSRFYQRVTQALLTGSSTDTVVIALTELSVVLADNPMIKDKMEVDHGKVVIDALSALARQMADHHLGYRQLTGPNRPPSTQPPT